MARSVQILGIRFFNGTVDEAVDTMSANGGLLVVPAGPTLVRLRGRRLSARTGLGRHGDR